MTGADHHRDDLDDRVWARLEPRLPGRVGEWGGIAEDNRRFVNAVLWILRTGSPWRDLPPDFGGWKNTHRRFCRLRDRGVWEQLLEVLIDEPGFEWLMVGTGPAGHRDGGGTTGSGEGLAERRCGRTSSLCAKVRLAVAAPGVSVGLPVTPRAPEGHGPAVRLSRCCRALA